MASDAQKNQMKIALVGMRPADQVTIKGYLRVLLRLDVELEWVGVNDLGIDLFMINNEFRDASSVAKLLETNAGVPVLYVTHSDNGEGGIFGDLLTLPLKQINLLNNWLSQHVVVLGGQPRPVNTNSFGQTQSAANQLSNYQPSHAQTSTQGVSATSQSSANAARIESLHDVIEMIEHLQHRSQSLFELSDNGQAIGIIDGARQLIWTQHDGVAMSDKWRIRPFLGQTPNPKEAKDSADWLWRAALLSHLSKDLIDNERRHQVRYWAKPTVQTRKDSLAVMTAIEKQALSATDIAYHTGVAPDTVKTILGALLLSGNLTASSYKDLKLSLTAKANKATESSAPTQPSHTPPQSGNQAAVQSMSAPSAAPKSEPKPEPKVETPQQEEKMGFLSRLRRKLGL